MMRARERQKPLQDRCFFRNGRAHGGEPFRIIFQNHVTGIRNTGAFSMLQGLNHAVGAFDRYKVGVAGAHDEGWTFDCRQGGP